MILRLALKQLWREWVSGELRLLLVALVVAVTATCAVGFFTDRVERALVRQSSEFLAADLVMRSARPAQDDLRAQAGSRQLAYSEQLIFPSMLVAGDAMLLASIKVVDAAYPLRGLLHIADHPGAPTRTVRSGPLAGEAWLEPRLLDSLQLTIGDEVELGRTRLRVSAVLMQEPDRSGGLFSLQPRALINRADLDATGVIQPGSRVSYRYLFSGPEDAIPDMQRWLSPRLQPGQRLISVDEDNPTLGKTLSRARSYLNLSGMLAVVMAGAAIAMSARRYSTRHLDGAALLRCFGLSQRQILQLHACQLLIAGALACLLGVLLGWLAQFGLFKLLSSLLPQTLPAAGMTPALVGFLTGILVLIGFALPPLLGLARVPPLRVLRRELLPMPAAAWFVYGLAALLILGLMWYYSNNLNLTLVVAAVGGVVSLILALTGWGLLALIRRIPGPLTWRLAHRNLQRHRRATLSQLLAFGITLGAMALILLVRSDLLDTWQSQLPDEAPNHFLINIQPHEQQPLADYLQQQAIGHSGIYPMVRGRLEAINGKAASEQLPPDSPGRRALTRELNLTWASELAADNRIQSGRWWQAGDEGKALISLEQSLARDLNVGLGDRLRFSFGTDVLEAEVISLRSLDWGSLRPNFYVIFPPGGLDDLPASFITSFYLPQERQSLLTGLMQQFPTLTLLEVERLLGNIRLIIAQVSLAVEYVLLFVLAAGLTLLGTALASSLDQRLQEGALLRTLGANSATLRSLLVQEYLLLGAIAGLLAALLDEAVLFGLYRIVLDLPYSPNPILWLATISTGAILVGLSGYIATRRVLAQSPLRVLREL